MIINHVCVLALLKIQTTKITKICKTREKITVNGMLPGPVVYANEGDRLIIRVTNETPQNATIHWCYPLISISFF